MKRIITFTFVLALLLVCYIKNNVNTVYAEDPDYLCFEFEGDTSDGSQTFLMLQRNAYSESISSTVPFISNLQYRIKYANGEWQNDWSDVSFNESSLWTYPTSDDSPLVVGDKIYFRRDCVDIQPFSTYTPVTYTDGSTGNEPCYYGFYNNYDEPSGTGSKFNVSGDVTTLITKNGGILDLTQTISGGSLDFCFYGLFMGEALNTFDVTLPSRKLSPHCYENMFCRCENLLVAPTLPATTLAEGCYSRMFIDCYDLVSAPILPATQLAKDCYRSMFSYCKSLQSTPELPATQLADCCYRNMFLGCDNLQNATALPATSLAYECYCRMFENCTNLLNAPALPATTLAEYCYAGMFMGCSSLTTPPELPATNLAPYCYQGMFAAQEQSNGITTAPELPATVLAEGCYQMMFGSMVTNGSKITVAPVLPATTLAPHCYEAMFASLERPALTPVSNGNKLKIAPELPALTLEDSCYCAMFAGCQQLEIAPELPATTLANSCSDSNHQGIATSTGCCTMMFAHCTSLKVPPELPATNLTDKCYAQMFMGCTGIEISGDNNDPYTVFYRIPSGNDTLIQSSVFTSAYQMFSGCTIPTANSSFSGTPDVSSGSATLYLKGDPLNISFDGNGTASALGQLQLDPLGLFTLPTASSISRSGYTLKGWSLRPDGKDNFYLPGASVNARGDMKFYAIWEEDNNNNNNPSSPSSGGSTRHIVPNTSVN